MHQAIVISKEGSPFRYVPLFQPHDQETRSFAETASIFIKNHGVSVCIGDQPSIIALDIAIETLTGARDEQIKSEQLYGKIIE